MNYRSIYLVFSLFVLLSGGSCYTARLNLSVLQQADTILPASINSLSILPIPGAPSKTGTFDSLKLFSGIDPYSVKMGFIHGMYSILSTSPRFSRVVLTDTSIVSLKDNPQIYWDDLERVCRHDTTDAVLILSRTVTLDKSDLYNEAFVNPFALLNKTRWIFYKPNVQKEVARFSYQDTIMLPGDYSIAFLNKVLLYEVCYRTGEVCGTRLVPYWNDVSRIIYSGPGKDLKDVAQYISLDKWRIAGLICNDLVSHRKTKIASRAAFNLALAFEHDDDLEQAYSWITYSDSIHSNALSISYKKILYSRLKNRAIIERQLAGN